MNTSKKPRFYLSRNIQSHYSSIYKKLDGMMLYETKFFKYTALPHERKVHTWAWRYNSRGKHQVRTFQLPQGLLFIRIK